MTYNRKNLCLLAGVPYAALQSLQRTDRDPFHLFMHELAASGNYPEVRPPTYSALDVVMLALAGAFSTEVSGIAGPTLFNSFGMVSRGFDEWHDYIVNARAAPGYVPSTFYFGFATRTDDWSAGPLAGVTLAQALAWAGPQEHTGAPSASRVFLIDVERVLQGILARSAEHNIAFAIEDIK